MKGQKFEVYLNRKAMGRSRKRVYSLRSATGKKAGRVLASSKRVLLENVQLVVQPSGRADTLRRLKEGNKVSRTVHAFLRGTVCARGNHATSLWSSLDRFNPCSVNYNPTKNDSFVADGEPVITARYAYCYEDDILIAN